MTKWEYCYTVGGEVSYYTEQGFRRESPLPAVRKGLVRAVPDGAMVAWLGQQGWEAFAVHTAGLGDTVYFRRPIPA